jgi:hypothetical protein
MKKLDAIKIVRDELSDFSEEIDTSDPEWTQILFNKRVSTLIRKRVLRTNKVPRKVLISEIIDSVVKPDPGDEIVEPAQHADEMLHSYGDGPDKREMREAQRSLYRVVELIDEMLSLRSRNDEGD